MLKFLFAVIWIFTWSMAAAQDKTTGAAPTLVPEPVALQLKKGDFQFSPNTRIIAAAGPAENIARLLSDMLSIPMGFIVKVAGTATKSHTNTVLLKLNSVPVARLGNEGYSLEVSPVGVVLSANKPAGLFYGMRTMMQLLPPAIENRTRQPGISWKLPCVDIIDFPRFAWRGLMLDVSRHFFPKEFIMKYIDQMARYKLNVFHWHLTDDQGWRIEIKQLPKLTEVGAWRVDRTGRPSRFEPPQPYEKTTYGGYYTQEDIKEIVQFAASRFVTIVPEIDLPGHSIALFASYPELSCTKVKYPVNVGSPFFKGTHEVCVAGDSTWLVLDQIFTEVAGLFPGNYIHIGGDEVDYKFWLNCDQDKKLMKQHGLRSGKELQAFFTRKLTKLVNAKGKQIIGWDEILDSDLAPGSAVMSWRNLNLEIEAAKRGYPVVMTPTQYSYLDYAQGDTIVEPAFFRKLRISTVYEFEPVPGELDPGYAKYIMGGQGNLWTENVFTYRHAEYMTWPRALALAEVFWSPKHKRNWVDFVRRMEGQLKFLDAAGVNYSPAVYDPVITGYIDKDAGPAGSVNPEEKTVDTTFYPKFTGHRLDKNLKIKLATEITGLDIYYTFDGSNPDNFYTKYNGQPLAIPKGALGNSEIRVITYRDGKPIGRQINCKLSEVARRIE